MANMNYVLYSKEFEMPRGELATKLPDGCRLEIWTPSKLCFYPGGIKGIRRKMDFISIWILNYLLKLPAKSGCSVFLVANAKKIIHHSIVTAKSFKYPFMAEDDLQVGMIFTKKEFRRKGLAEHTINEILKKYEKCGRKIWYITEDRNIPSRALAEKFGFSNYSRVIRKRTLLGGKYDVPGNWGNRRK